MANLSTGAEGKLASTLEFLVELIHKEVQIQTINRRRNYNRGLRELANAA